MAIEAIAGRPHPLDDPEMAAVDPSPTSLDLVDSHLDGGVCLSSRGFRRPVDPCPRCGLGLTEGCMEIWTPTTHAKCGGGESNPPALLLGSDSS